MHRGGTRREKTSVLAFDDKLSMREKFRRHGIAAKLNRKAHSLNRL
jgi:hypothetical protein